MTTLRYTLEPTLKENTMNRSLIVFTGIASIAIIWALSTQLDNSVQAGSSAKMSGSAKIDAFAKIPTVANRKPHRLAVQVDVNDPAIMNLALNNVSNTIQHYSEIGQKVEIEMVAFGPGLHMLR